MPVNGCHQGNRAATEWRLLSSRSVVGYADFPHQGVAQVLRDDVQTALLERIQNLVASVLQVLHSARGMCRVPIVADRIIREHIDQIRVSKLVPAAGVADAFRSGSSHVLGQANDVGVLIRPVAALPQFAVRTARDDGWVPGRTALVRVVEVVREADCSVYFAPLLNERHEPIVSAQPGIHFRDRRIAGIFPTILPAPQVRILWRLGGKGGNLPDEIRRLRKGRGRLGPLRLVAMKLIHQLVVVVMCRDLRHSGAHQLCSIEPVHYTVAVQVACEIQTAQRALARQQIGRVLIAEDARRSRAGVHVVRQAAIGAVSLDGSQPSSAVASLTLHGQLCGVHEGQHFLNAERLVGSDHHHRQRSRNAAPETVLVQPAGHRIA